MQKQKVSPFMFVLCVLAIKSALGNYVAPSSSSSLVIPSFSPLSHTQMQILYAFVFFSMTFIVERKEWEG